MQEIVVQHGIDKKILDLRSLQDCKEDNQENIDAMVKPINDSDFDIDIFHSKNDLQKCQHKLIFQFESG